MKRIFLLFLILIILSCQNNTDKSSEPFYKVYVANQSQDYVTVINSEIN